MKHEILSATFLMGLCAMAQAAGTVQFSQTVQLRKGWNAFYLTVAPTVTPDELFADWPVNDVAAYDAAAFQATKQYSASDTTEGMQRNTYRTWHRGDKGASTLRGFAANAVYLCFATNAMPATAVYGVPCAPRVSWHASSLTDAAGGMLNLVGLSVSQATPVGDYFAGADVTSSAYRQFYGTDAANPGLGTVYASQALGMGDVVVMESDKVSDWSGALYVSPLSGVDFGTNATLAAVSVRNDGATSRTVRVSLSGGSAANATDVPPVPPGMKIKDTSTVLASGSAWTDFTPSAPFEKKLAAGETLTLSLALDRTQLAGAGTYYGGLLVVTDVDGGSNMRVVVPVEATSDGGVSVATAWPTGIWLATAELDTVSFVGGEVEVTNRLEGVDKDTGETSVEEVVETVKGIRDVAAGGTMKVRLPLVVDRAGDMTLLQRFWYGRDTNGVLHVLSGSETSAVALSSPRRVSTAFLPTDQVKIAAADGVFGKTATFPFVVGEDSNVNPMRHALHPNHDGKRFDFETPSPSGDDLENYKGTVKPELFSITNTVYFTWSDVSGTAWNPEETLKGELTWEFGGLRHEGAVRAKGPFVMKRITSATPEK